jgi:hypothetical protein
VRRRPYASDDTFPARQPSVPPPSVSATRGSAIPQWDACCCPVSRATNVLRPFHHLAGIAPIVPHHPHARLLPVDVTHHQPCLIPVLSIGGMNHHRHHQTHGIHQQMACAPVDGFASIIPSSFPFSVVVTDWRSRIAALGSAARPAAPRMSVRRASWMRTQVPSRCQHRTE